METLTIIIQAVIVPILIAIGGFVCAYFNNKTKKLNGEKEADDYENHNNIAEKTIEKAIKMVNQTYVNNLKDGESFDEQSQQEAFNKTYDTALAIMSEETKAYLENKLGDFELWVKTTIEEKIDSSKV